jgi:hypothetical protein
MITGYEELEGDDKEKHSKTKSELINETENTEVEVTHE